MRRLIDEMKRLPATHGPVTYARGIRAAALSLFNRPEDRTALADDVTYLLKHEHQGAYTYGPATFRGLPWDNSNSQYGLLGVWSGAEAGIEVPLDYWARVERHWSGSQQADGRFYYSLGQPGSLTMTCAALASLSVTHDYLDLPQFRGDVGRDPFSPSMSKGLEWLETDTNYLRPSPPIIANDLVYPGYATYGIERVGLATGFKYFGMHNWYREVAGALVAQQNRDGSWGTGEFNLNTSYILIFLARGRHPVVMNKLRFDAVENLNNKYWANRPRDTANLARWLGREMERPLNWQIVNLEHDWTDWLDAPVLYVASHRNLRFREEDYANFRKYVEAGYMIFTQADGDDYDFNDFVKFFAKKLFPKYELQDLPPTHPIYSVNYQLLGRPPLKAVTNGSRILLLHSPKDISRYWQTRDDKLHRNLFRFGANLFLYAGGKRELRNKLNTIHVPEPSLPPVATINVARVQYNSNWDPEPYAWRRFARVFQNNTGTALEVNSVVWRDLRPGLAPLAHLTGTAAYDPAPSEIDAMRSYVQGGGVLLIDACGGAQPFIDSMRKALALAFPDSRLSPATPAHPLLSKGPPGMADLGTPKVRIYVSEKVGAHYGGFELLSAGKGHAILCTLDVTSGLLGTDTWGIWGFDADYAQSFMQNAIFWTVDGQHGLAASDGAGE